MNPFDYIANLFKPKPTPAPTPGLIDSSGRAAAVPQIQPQIVNYNPTAPNTAGATSSDGLGSFNRPVTSGGGGTGGGNPNPSPTTNAVNTGGGGLDFNAILDRQRGEADRLYGQARGLYDEGIRNLGAKRDQFKTVFDQGKTDILQGFQKGAGEMQTAASGMNERNLNALRALGLGGSAVVRTQGRQDQNNMRALAGLQDSRAQNENANTNAFNENENWAKSQESGLNQFLQNAGNQRQSAQNNIVDNVANMFNNIINNQMAYNASMGQKVANPYAVNMPETLNTLTSALGNAGMMNTGNTTQNVNLDQNNLALLDQLKRRSGVFGQTA
jgi:hypothetical protein